MFVRIVFKVSRDNNSFVFDCVILNVEFLCEPQNTSVDYTVVTTQ